MVFASPVHVGVYFEKNLSSWATTNYYGAGGTRVAMRKGGVVSGLPGDHLGSASLATNSSGGVVANSSTRYYPYGATRSGGSGMPTDYRFTGQRIESALGIYQMGARWYDGALGRWLSADSIVPGPANPQSLNRYSYVLGNPLGYVDPSGHHECSPTGACTDDPEPTPGERHGDWGHSPPYVGNPPGVVPIPTPTGYDPEESVQEATSIRDAWWSNSCPSPWRFGPEGSLTQDIMYDRGMQAFYEAWAAAGYRLPFTYQHTADERNNGWLPVRIYYGVALYAHENRQLREALRGNGSQTARGEVDAVGGIIGSFDRIEAYDAGDRVRIEVHNTTNWNSGLRVPGTNWSPGGWVPRLFPSWHGTDGCVQVFTFYVTKP
jgi:RHS repeat-associated protein